ncbi:response regulator [Microvirga tunisiensis]|uniref:Response regulator n=2 Tax=Pannonibacter tanglangensis TaxID=2750084 RepID=A0ABW9ZKP9_9HYPH|nr:MULTISPECIES: hybrid sensor histidine kinase/response regulator [unclassified Pannonibacter]NBN65483.1 response regulator [Pannonibacter sp. XCT-34]NBN80290.1 response regulator [Pannonibacter sp. XCT-53]
MADKDSEGPQAERAAEAGLALVAHDLRTPLNAMRLTAEMIAQGPLQADQQERLGVLLDAIDALTAMTSDLIQRGRTRPATDRTLPREDARLILQSVHDLFSAVASRKRLDLILTLTEQPLPLDAGTAVAFRRITSTLVDNALKYTQRGHVRLDLAPSPRGTALQLAVTDTGPGIDVLERSRLFRPFTRGAAGRAGGSGAGLGLWGARALAADAGGHLDLHTATSGGCRFEVGLPLALDGLTPGHRTSEAAVAAHVLIVDDNDTNRRLLSALLESFSMTSDQAPNGPIAVAMAARTAYDAVLMDLHMPGMSGIETAEALRDGPDGHRLPLIAVTAALESVGDRRLRQAGFQEVLAKPLSPAHLYQALDLARERHRQRLAEASLDA